MGRSGRPSTVNDLHRLSQAMPHITVEVGRSGNRIYRVGRKSFVFFRTPRPDRCLTAVRWLVENGYGPPAEHPEVAMSRSSAGEV